MEAASAEKVKKTNKTTSTPPTFHSPSKSKHELNPSASFAKNKKNTISAIFWGSNYHIHFVLKDKKERLKQGSEKAIFFLKRGGGQNTTLLYINILKYPVVVSATLVNWALIHHRSSQWHDTINSSSSIDKSHLREINDTERGRDLQ